VAVLWVGSVVDRQSPHYPPTGWTCLAGSGLVSWLSQSLGVGKDSQSSV
jgi:hypothetical protein